MSPQVILRPFREEDLDKLIELQVRILNPNLSHEDGKRLWDWLFKKNPFSSSRVPHASVLEDEGKVVASMGHIAFPIKLGEKTAIAYATSSFMTDEEHRFHGLKLAADFFGNRNIPFMLSTTANETACRIFKAFGAKELTLARSHWSRVIRYKKIIKASLKRRNIVIRKIFSNNIVLSLISAPIDLLLRIGITITTKTFKKGLEIREQNEFGTEFDKLWEEISPSYQILVVRDSKYLNWRYGDYPLRKPKIFSAYDEEGNLRGFAVVQLVPSEPQLAHIQEMFTKPGDKRTQEKLLAAVLRYAVAEKVDLIMTAGLTSEIHKLLKKNLFRRRQARYSPYLYKNNGAIPAHVSENEENWYISLGDLG